ncbi:hypothetical protein BKM31_30990 [[Actinomadura] parvosata subsp. kistnae]|uniref:CU044_5270 family protein n=1 Tax=[Actinomadura] parvosata subsp. kistnae TaxID=1909395 RepID=A0A1V0A503_9ACTN|nr:hypothetical protein [Nonomuraea sp. ATCC 55076]AQZ65284.1 hypothetical protein BKM31_30990 [Nonomuraea sp. ATCC 55076]
MDDFRAVRELLPPPPLDPRVEQAGRERLSRAFAQERRVRRGRWSAAGVALLGAAAAAAVVMTSAPPVARQVTPPAGVATLSADRMLLAAAETVARQPDEGAWWGSTLVNGREFDDPEHRYRLRQSESAEVWIPADPEARTWYRTTYLGAEPASEQDKAAWQAAGSPASWTYGGQTPGLVTRERARGVVSGAAGEPETWSSEDWDFRVVLAGRPLTKLGDVPDTPEGLRALFGAGVDERALADNVVRLLVYAPVTSGTRAAAYRLLASLTGVTAAGRVTDVLGRPGEGLEYRSGELPVTGYAGETRTRLVIDPATGKPLSIETRTAQDGRLLEYTAIRESVWTDHNPLKETK